LTTRCSSAFALIASCWVVLCAQTPPPRPHPQPASPQIDRTLPSLFPTTPVWTLALNNQLTAAPEYDESRVYFAIDGDRVVAYEILSGARSWLVSARPEMALVAGDGLLFLVEADVLTALNATTGAIAWQLPMAEKLAVRPVWDNGWLVLATQAGELLAFRAADGYLVWRHDLKSPAHALPALAADRVYVPTTDNRIVALRIDTGEPLWERRLGGSPNEILGLEERLYVGAEDNFFYCLKAKDGGVAWRWRTGGDVVGQPLADEDRVYFVALDNVLRALDVKSGVQHWMRPLALRPAWGATKAGSTLIVGGLTASLPAFDLKDGKPAGELTAGAEVAAPPHALEDPRTRVPMVVMVTHDIAKGASASLVTRSFEPAMSPVAALPNLVQIAPTATPPR
jgi:outer membrane protein assembly factor BamB